MDYDEVKKIYDKNINAVNGQLVGSDPITANAFIASSYTFLKTTQVLYGLGSQVLYLHLTGQ